METTDLETKKVSKAKSAERRILALIIVLCIAIGFVIGIIYSNITESERSKQFRTLDLIIDEIQKNYYDEVEREALIEAAIKGMFTELDSYSMAYTCEEYQSIAASNAGQNKNFGYSVRTLPRRPVSVARVTGGSPAEKAELKAGDEIIGIRFSESENVMDTSYMTSADVYDLLRTPKYKLTVQRMKPDVLLNAINNGKTGSELYKEFENPDNFTVHELPSSGMLESAEYNVRYVNYYINSDTDNEGNPTGTNITDANLLNGFDLSVDGSEIAYIRLTEFSGTAAEEFDEAMRKFKAARKKKLILDLRDNPGGNTNVLGKIASYLIYNNDPLQRAIPVFVAKYKDGRKAEYKTIASTATGKARNYTDFFGEYEPDDKKIIVLVNGMSASASEALSSAIEDYGTGTLVGTTTYKKGIMQSTYNLQSMGVDYYLKVTVATYFSAVTDKTLHGVGLTPEKTSNAATNNYIEDNYYGFENCRRLLDDKQFFRALVLLGYMQS